MKAKIILLIILVSTIFVSCGDIDEVPPRASTSLENRYYLPKGTPLTQQERDILNAMRLEYENATK